MLVFLDKRNVEQKLKAFFMMMMVMTTLHDFHSTKYHRNWLQIFTLRGTCNVVAKHIARCAITLNNVILKVLKVVYFSLACYALTLVHQIPLIEIEASFPLKASLQKKILI